MAGAAYTMPQEASAAVFGNPATLTQLKGINMNFGASYLGITSLETESIVGGTTLTKSKSDADDYIVPDFGITLQVSPNLVLGTGLEVDAGLGADYRDDPVNLGGIASLPLVVEVISFNANFAGAYQATEKLSVGASVTVGFGLAQLGTVGAVNNLLPTASVHDIGFGASLGATYKINDGIMASATVKSEVEYNFASILSNALPGSTNSDFQDLRLQQPMEIIVGLAFTELAPNLLVEADLIFKKWSEATTYEDVYDDQFVFALGAQYEMGDITVRAGYSYAENMLRGTTGQTLDNTNLSNGLGASGQDVATYAQMTLLPVIWEHTVTAGASYAVTDAVSIDAYAAYAFGEDDENDLLGGVQIQKASLEEEVLVGVGLNIALP